MAVIGIDLGTSNSLAVVWKGGESVLIPNRFQDYLTPSVVSIDEDGCILVGKIAKERLVSHPEKTAALFKRTMGTGMEYQLDGKTFVSEELSALVIKALKEDAQVFLQEEITEAIISVPAYFNDSQRFATKKAGILAGLKVERLINEPSAAALAYRINDMKNDSIFLIVDFGGGTLDISIVDCFEYVVNIIGIRGDNHLGGSDIDQAIAKEFCRINEIDFTKLSYTDKAILLRRAEESKMELTDREQTTLTMDADTYSRDYTFSSAELITIATPILSRIIEPIQQVLLDSHMSISQIDQIILVGGSCKMPIISKYLTHVFGKKPIDYYPESVVALGAGSYAGIKERAEDIKDVILTDICPFTLGIEVFNEGSPSFGFMSPIIERNEILPNSCCKTFTTIHDNQKNLKCSVFQGEAMYVKDNILLGMIDIDIPPMPKGEETVEIRFTYDINGILEVQVSSNSTGETKKMLLVGNCGISQEAASQRIQELEALKCHPREQEENRLLIAIGQRLYEESLGINRANILNAISIFENTIMNCNSLEAGKVRRSLKHYFRELEAEKTLKKLLIFSVNDEAPEDESDSID